MEVTGIVKTAPKKRVGDVELLIQTGSGDREFEGSKRRLNACFSRGKTPRQCVYFVFSPKYIGIKAK